MNTKRRQSICSALLILTVGFLPAETIRYGGSTGWNRILSEGLRETEGWRGHRALTLSPLGRDPFQEGHITPEGDVSPDDIDLLLLSEPDGMANPVGHYRIEGSYEISSRFPARGETSIRPGEGGIRLYPSAMSMWAAGSEWGDFTLDFRLRPTTLRDGEIFFSWEGRGEGGESQSVMAWVDNRRLIWEFRRFFRRGTDRSLELRLVSPPLIPGEWRHHRIRFKLDAFNSGSSGASPGLLEYLVDGVPSDMVHATRDGREGSEIFAPRIGALSDRSIQLAPSFSGYLDEFRLVAAAAARPPSGGYADREASASGVGRTEVINSGYPGSSLHRVRARYEAPGATRVRFFARSFDHREETWTSGMPASSDPSWVELKMEEEPEDPTGFGRWFQWAPEILVNGRYFVIGYILDPDPGADLAPVLSVLEIEYVPRLPPRPPLDIQQEESLDGRIRISWSPEAEAGVVGWWISWGPRPGDYVSTGPDDNLHGTAWVPRIPGSMSRPEFTWPRELGNRIVYTSVRSAWAEGGPDDGTPLQPRDYDALSIPTQEMNIRP